MSKEQLIDNYADVDEVGAKAMPWYSVTVPLGTEIVRNNMPDYSFGEVVIKLFIEVLDHVAQTTGPKWTVFCDPEHLSQLSTSCFVGIIRRPEISGNCCALNDDVLKLIEYRM